MTTENAVRDFLLLKGVQLFWVDSAVNYIRQAMASNTYFVTHVIDHKVLVSATGYVKRYMAVMAVTYPDTGTRGSITINYTFDPYRKVAHRVKVKANANRQT